ncbi:unnamed protein product [Rhizophagus irregularis]|uniref:Uncharacterized protein n=1 Tax=Rhizophagus irregularis TaxID=588596 RepID=A0A916DXS3_9GLOM|nr:unnamed protein product [Rhizophagus irregularis]CAB5293949.1 unnamed protein product [Rhizophagus irregularis]
MKTYESLKAKFNLKSKQNVPAGSSRISLQKTCKFINLIHNAVSCYLRDLNLYRVYKQARCQNVGLLNSR